MTTQFHFVFNDVKNKKLYYFRLAVQLVCALLIIAECFSIFLSVSDLKEKYSVFKDSSAMYLVRGDDNAFFDFVAEDYKEAKRRSSELYNYVKESDKSIVYTKQNTFIYAPVEKNLDIEFADDGMENNLCEVLQVDENFINFFKFDLIEGRMLNTEDFVSGNEKIPVVVGANYRSACSIGDILDGSLEIVGFLENDSFYISPGEEGEVLYLDNIIMAPLEIEDDPIAYLFALKSSTIITDNNSVLNDIKNKSEELDLFDIEFVSYTEQLHTIIEEKMTILFVYGFIAFLVLFFSMICTISSIMTYIEKHLHEFAVHMICGAKKIDFLIRIMIPIFFIMIIAMIVVFMSCGFTEKTLLTLIFSVLLLFFIALFPAVKIAKKSVNEFFRRNE